MHTPITVRHQYAEDLLIDANGSSLAVLLCGKETEQSIIRACNSHDELLQACKAALTELSNWHELGAIRVLLKSAIAKAEPKP